MRPGSSAAANAASLMGAAGERNEPLAAPVVSVLSRSRLAGGGVGAGRLGGGLGGLAGGVAPVVTARVMPSRGKGVLHVMQTLVPAGLVKPHCGHSIIASSD